ncbi:MAG: zinc ribbon domain-containing protein [Acidobacteria bacterium]|jgi:putative FmdB family regulatory protein|nr:zinc ribbon domain-containing protein [Acidobacteriota bacterium]
MPTYEYECAKCKYKFEKMQPITAAPLTRCPKCQGRVQRIISGGAGFIMKGAARGAAEKSGGDCGLQRTGKTCCGRDERCGKPACGDGE